MNLPFYFFGISKKTTREYDYAMDNILDYIYKDGTIKGGYAKRDYTANKVFCDSGGFYLVDKEQFWNIDTVIDVQEQIKADYVAPLDYPIRPYMTLYTIEKRHKKTLENMMYWDNNTNLNMIPIVHGYNKRSVKRSIKYISKFFSPDMIGIGSIISKEEMKLCKQTKKRDIYSTRRLNIDVLDKYLDVIKCIKEYLGDIPIHIFGGGSTPLSLHILTYIGFSSFDSVGYRTASAYGKILIQGRGGRHVTDNQTTYFQTAKLSKGDFFVLSKCECNVCKSLPKNGRQRVEAFKNSWMKRALHNKYTLERERDIAEKKLLEGDCMYAKFIRKYIKKNNTVRNVFEHVVKKKRKLKI